MKKLNIKNYPMQWENIFDEVMDSYDKNGCMLVDHGYLQKMNEEYHIFTHRFTQVLCAAEKIRKNEPLARYLMLLNITIMNRSHMEGAFGMIELPEALERIDSIGYDLLALFALLPTIPASFESYRAHHVPEDVIENTIKEYENGIDDFERRFGKPGFNKANLSWGYHIINTDLLRIGRFNFEMNPSFAGRIKVFKNKQGDCKTLVNGLKLHRDGFALGIPGFQDERDSYYGNLIENEMYCEGYPVINEGRASNVRIRLDKKEWMACLNYGDPVISIHIPTGESITPEICENSLIKADTNIRRWYPEFNLKAYVCFSWMMDPQLSKMLKQESNILAFQRRFTQFPTVSSGQAIFKFVFLKQYKNMEDLPEATSLERVLKKHYLEGHYIYEPGGFFIV